MMVPAVERLIWPRRKTEKGLSIRSSGRSQGLRRDGTEVQTWEAEAFGTEAMSGIWGGEALLERPRRRWPPTLLDPERVRVDWRP